jgi:outer membrane protein assembly factor BamE (lipoprotein component of BamABCDE complex)
MTKVFFLSLIILCSIGCTKIVYVSGHLFEDKELNALQKANSKQDVETILGSPTSVSSFGPETWYYITTKKETISFWPAKILEQNIIAVGFKKNDKIDVIARYNEKNIKNHKLVPEITIVKGNDLTTAQQFFGNVGRFNKNKKEPQAMPRNGF